MLKVFILIVLVGAGTYAGIWLITWAESRRSMSGGESGGSTMTNAFLSVQALFEPGKQHVIEERMRQQDDRDDRW